MIYQLMSSFEWNIFVIPAVFVSCFQLQEFWILPVSLNYVIFCYFTALNLKLLLIVIITFKYLGNRHHAVNTIFQCNIFKIKVSDRNKAFWRLHVFVIKCKYFKMFFFKITCAIIFFIVICRQERHLVLLDLLKYLMS